MVISALLGAPEEDEEQLREWTDATLHIEPGEIMGAHATDLFANLHNYWQAHIDERRRQPRDDIMSELMTAELDEDDGSTRLLTDAEIHGFMGLISGAGNETVARFLGWSAVGLDQFPAERRQVGGQSRADPERGRGDPALGGAVGDPGSLGHARRRVPRHGDPRRFQESRCSPARPTATSACGPTPTASRSSATCRRHVAFGYGIHFCLGAALARFEGRIALEETLQTVPDLVGRHRPVRDGAHQHRARLRQGADHVLSASRSRSAQMSPRWCRSSWFVWIAIHSTVRSAGSG